MALTFRVERVTSATPERVYDILSDVAAFREDQAGNTPRASSDSSSSFGTAETRFPQHGLTVPAGLSIGTSFIAIS
jgi:hypothetical protein